VEEAQVHKGTTALVGLVSQVHTYHYTAVVVEELVQLAKAETAVVALVTEL
jgi:hypothetical protein